MKKIAVIPARYQASRFPGKLMQPLGGMSVILRTYRATLETNLFDRVLVATDSDIIYREITSNGGEAIMSLKEHQTGSDRIAEAVERIDTDIVVNVQGDEPFTRREPLEALLKVFEGPDADKIDLASLRHEITSTQDIENPNIVKVITDKDHFALYFSRYPIPYPRDPQSGAKHYRHIGIYAFRKESLLNFSHWKMLPNEASEKIECIRYLEYGKKIKMVDTPYVGIGIDTPEDLIKAENFLKQQNKL